MKHKTTFKPTLKRKDIPLKKYIKSRIVSPRALIEAIKKPINNDYRIGNVIFSAIYYSGKAIEGYDFV